MKRSVFTWIAFFVIASAAQVLSVVGCSRSEVSDETKGSGVIVRFAGDSDVGEGGRWSRAAADLLNLMDYKRRIGVGLVACIFALVACRSPGPQSAEASATTGNGLYASVAERPKQNVRKLRSSLPGKKMSEVVTVLGQPAQVFTLEDRETWTYDNAAYDPVTGQSVRSLEVLFASRVVASVDFSY